MSRPSLAPSFRFRHFPFLRDWIETVVLRIMPMAPQVGQVTGITRLGVSDIVMVIALATVADSRQHNRYEYP